MNENDGKDIEDIIQGSGKTMFSNIATDSDTMQDTTDRNNIDMKADARKAREMRDMNMGMNEEPVSGKDIQKEAAVMAGMNLNSFTEKVYDTLRKFGVYNGYNNYTEKDVEKMRKANSSTKSDMKKHQMALEGRLTYEPMVSGSKQELRERQRIPQSQKGLVYLADEGRDYAKFSKEMMLTAENNVELYVKQVSKLESEIAKHSADTTPSSIAKVRELRDQKYKAGKLVQEFQDLQSSYAREVTRYCTLTQRFNNQISIRRAKIEEAKDDINDTEIVIEILGQYVRNKKSGDTLDDTIKKIHTNGEKAAKYGPIIDMFEQNDLASMQGAGARRANMYGNDGRSSEISDYVNKSRELNIAKAKEAYTSLGI